MIDEKMRKAPCDECRERLEAVVQTLKWWLRHDEDCYGRRIAGECDCGLAEALAFAEVEP